MNIFSVCWLFTLLIAHVKYLGRHKYQHFFPDWEMLRGLDALRFSLLATDPLSSDWPCTLLSTAVNYYYFIIFLCLMICYLRTTLLRWAGALRFGYKCTVHVGVDVEAGDAKVDVIYISFIMSVQYIGYLVPYEHKVLRQVDNQTTTELPCTVH